MNKLLERQIVKCHICDGAGITWDSNMGFSWHNPCPGCSGLGFALESMEAWVERLQAMCELLASCADYSHRCEFYDDCDSEDIEFCLNKRIQIAHNVVKEEVLSNESSNSN